MNALLLAAFMNSQPLPALPPQTLEALFRSQQDTVLQDLRIGIQAELEQRAARFFSADGELQQQLQVTPVIDTDFAAR